MLKNVIRARFAACSDDPIEYQVRNRLSVPVLKGSQMRGPDVFTPAYPAASATLVFCLADKPLPVEFDGANI